MLSRVADSIYWLNRYIERAENVARFVDVNLNLMLDLPSEISSQWQPLVSITGDLGLYKDLYGDITSENVIRFLTLDEEYPNSILSCLVKARENARSCRETISSEMWEEVNGFYHMVKGASPQQSLDYLPSFCSQVKLKSHQFCGVMDSTMAHNEGWHFGQLGRLLERADKTTRMLDVKYFLLLPSAQWVGTPLDQVQWISLLKSASAYEMYRKCQHKIAPETIADFLVLDRQFPRSIYFCLKQAENHLHSITNTPVGTWCNGAERALGKLCSELGYIVIADVIDAGLHEFLDGLQSSINTIDDRIYTTFLSVDKSRYLQPTWGKISQ
ncbi:MAG: alpha-E domain-containing protein [Cyanobacteria bacterium P01_E01_bin.34]